jgi:ubiquinone/menaquinone biosynthesis C-methylase UbiE
MDKDLSRKFFNQQAATWDQTIRKNHSRQLDAVAECIKVQPDDWVLDVGTGTGVFIPYIHQYVNGNGRIICVDYAINMLLRARQKKTSEDVTFICSEVETLNCFTNTFDCVICYATFPHFHDKIAALTNIHRMMKPRAALYIFHTAGREAINAIHRGISDLDDHLIPEVENMRTLLIAAGFLQIEIEDLPDSYMATANKI